MRSMGERIHRIRLHIGWSAEECAYRTTIEANTHIAPITWLDWERCSDEQAASNGLVAHLDAICRLFDVDKDWLIAGVIEDPDMHDSRVLAFPPQSSRDPHKS